MISIPYKAKQFLVFLAKLLIVGGALYFIYNQLATNEKLDWNQFLALLERKKSIAGIAFILSLSFLNRFLEILKWQNLAQKLKPISLSKATEQVLAALTAGLFTPNGDYEPINLTEEWLAKLGYDLISENHYGVLGHLIWKIEGRFYCDKNGMQLKHVHQLQNLYFALTGSELTVA